ncbi:MAG: flavodoxin-dependent (E)-4-hydroxy-3-methylbut-2-enyl-diphosphate synthase, partial [Nitrospirota bacterium]|nr:flavodoxin-dependent (E)-4-hydroxy-3-methylbut-2-enyl-diphosphate synthase [Nitrospirota bacterium]
KRRISIPLVADIHYNHHLALEAIKQGVDCIRINPGNLVGGRDSFREVKTLSIFQFASDDQQGGCQRLWFPAEARITRVHQQSR